MNDPEKFLHKGLLKWVHEQGWVELRDIQIQAIPPILENLKDVIISASTASGKTEAAFLPAITLALERDLEGFSILYISPLKALINDQTRRLNSLTRYLEFPVIPWHGDISQTLKREAEHHPRGVLLITPESLEAMLIRDMDWAQKSFKNLSSIVIDEYHYFVGTDRGIQLISLLNRIEVLTQKSVQRIALSATLGDMALVGKTLRSKSKDPTLLIQGSDGSGTLKLSLYGFEDPLPSDMGMRPEDISLKSISDHLFYRLRGKSHLVFANSRQKTESVAHNLLALSQQHLVQNEFFPHHGNLSNQDRVKLEERLNEGRLPTTAICTSTLELGIDIGKVFSINQIGSPPGVASLRQRLGRSGRRSGVARLNLYIRECHHKNSGYISEKLRLSLFQSIAILKLLIMKKWYEPPPIGVLRYSALIHQVLSLTAQYGGLKAKKIYEILCKNEQFGPIRVSDFTKLLKGMGKNKLIQQLRNGDLVLGILGEQVVGDYHFYSVFSSPTDYTIKHKGHQLGSLPLSTQLIKGQSIIFSGKPWRILDVDELKKVIFVEKCTKGVSLKFDGSIVRLHDKIRESMLDTYLSQDPTIDGLDILDEKATELFYQGVENFNNLGLESRSLFEWAGSTYLFPWKGDIITSTISFILASIGIGTEGHNWGIIKIDNQESVIRKLIIDHVDDIESISSEKLASTCLNRIEEKFDSFLPDSLLNQAYASRSFDLQSAKKWIKNNLY